jgi:2-oxo-4-hydroxy-4-carboxy-5-ureidoimidazoline decarboxylase
MTEAAHLLSPLPRALDREAFLARFGGVYEHSPWIAAARFDAGLDARHDTAEGLSEALAAIVEAAPEAARLALLRAHPDLAGRLAVAGALTASSAAEQAGAGLDRCTPEQFARFTALNAAYTARFGFPFIIAVRGLDRARILAAFETRAANDPATEFATALAQVHRIALLRLRQL